MYLNRMLSNTRTLEKRGGNKMKTEKTYFVVRILDSLAFPINEHKTKEDACREALKEFGRLIKKKKVEFVVTEV